MNPTGIKWERVLLPTVKTSHRGRTTTQTIRLSKASKAGRFNRMYISGDLCEAVGLKHGDSIWLYKYGNLFMIKKESSDYKVKHGKNCESASLWLTDMDFCDTLLPKINGSEFDAWVEGDGIVFRSKKEEGVA